MRDRLEIRGVRSARRVDPARPHDTDTERSAVYYETVFIVNPDTSRENAEKLTDGLVAKVEQVGGRIVKRENWGVRPLAYSIAKRKRGHYLLLVTDGGPEAVAALERAIKLDERIIRFLTVRLTELSDRPSPLLRRGDEERSSNAGGDGGGAKPDGDSAERGSDPEGGSAGEG